MTNSVNLNSTGRILSAQGRNVAILALLSFEVTLYTEVSLLPLLLYSAVTVLSEHDS